MGALDVAKIRSMTGKPLEAWVGIITGAGRGIGAATARELSRLGTRLVLVDLSLDALVDVARQVTESGGEVLPIAADIRKFEEMERVAEECIHTYGAIDFTVANAALANATSLSEGDPRQWREIIETNVLGTLHTVRAVSPAMRQRGSGHIVLMSSVSGRETYVGEPVYIASKWAIVGLGHALRQEMREHSIRVTLIEPGLVDTPMARGNSFGNAWIERFNPLQPEDVARAIDYALTQPKHMAINEIVLRPLAQEV